MPREPGVQGLEVRAVHRLPQEPASPADGRTPARRATRTTPGRRSASITRAPRSRCGASMRRWPARSATRRPPLQAALKFDRCATCHQDPHRGAFKQDCSGCHNESGFGRGTFDHATGTKFPLTGAHAPAGLREVPQERGRRQRRARRASSISAGWRRPARRATRTCTRLNWARRARRATRRSFRVPGFNHPRLPEFFAGQHQSVPCAKCHVARAPGAPARTGVPVDGWTFKNLPTACATCHQDVHLGQVGTACEACHRVDAAKFAPVKFSHAKAAFTLTGRHETVECRKCHKPETGAFPAGAGTAVRLKGLATACASCHQDQHLGQLGGSLRVVPHARVVQGRGLHARQPGDVLRSGSTRRSPARPATSRRTAAYPGWTRDDGPVQGRDGLRVLPHRRARRLDGFDAARAATRRKAGCRPRARSTRPAGSTSRAGTWPCPARPATSTAR